MLEADENATKIHLAIARAKIRASVSDREKLAGDRLTGTPISLTSILRGAMERFPVSTDTEQSMWSNISAKITIKTPANDDFAFGIPNNQIDKPLDMTLANQNAGSHRSNFNSERMQTMQNPVMPPVPPRSIRHGRKTQPPIKIIAIAAALLVVVVLCIIFIPRSGEPGEENNPNINNQNNPVTSPPANNNQPTRRPAANVPVSIDVAQNTPGVYIMEGDRFTLISPFEMKLIESGGGAVPDEPAIGTMSVPSLEERYKTVRDNINVSDFLSIPAGSQLVLVGIERLIDVSEIIGDFYTLSDTPYLFIRNNDSPRCGLFTGPGFARSHTSVYDYETINGESPAVYIPRLAVASISSDDRFIQITSDISDYLSRREIGGYLSGSIGEEFKFGKFEGTQWVEDTFTINKQMFISVSLYSVEGHYEYNVERTMDGYFLLTLKEAQTGKFILRYNVPDPQDNNNYYSVTTLLDFSG